MADATYQDGVYRAQGGDQIVVASGGSIKVETGGSIVPNSGTQASAVADATAVSVTYTANAVSGNGSVTVADGSTPTNAEILEFVEEVHTVQESIVTKLNSVIAALEGAGILAS